MSAHTHRRSLWVNKHSKCIESKLLRSLSAYFDARGHHIKGSSPQENALPQFIKLHTFRNPLSPCVPEARSQKPTPIVPCAAHAARANSFGGSNDHLLLSCFSVSVSCRSPRLRVPPPSCNATYACSIVYTSGGIKQQLVSVQATLIPPPPNPTSLPLPSSPTPSRAFSTPNVWTDARRRVCTHACRLLFLCAVQHIRWSGGQGQLKALRAANCRC